MSRAYRIKVSESLNRVIRASDHVSTQLELLEILPQETMAALLEKELETLVAEEPSAEEVEAEEKKDS